MPHETYSMTETQPVLVCASIVVRAPCDSDALQKFLDRVYNCLQECIQPVHSESWFQENKGCCFRYLADEKNAMQCSRCGTWTTNYNAPEPIPELMVGYDIDGKRLCDQYRAWMKDEGVERAI